MENFKIQLDYFDEDGNRSLKETTVSMNTLKDVTDNSVFGRQPLKKFDINFSVKIPNHVHTYILGKTVPVFGMGSNTDLTYDLKFSKTISAPTLLNVCERYNKVMEHYDWLKTMEKANMMKVIFYEFNNSTNELRAEFNGDNLGLKNSLNYKHAIGYVVVNNNREQRYNHEKRMINSGREQAAYKMKYVAYTEEREAFFNKMQISFETIIDNINNFESNLSEESINQIIEKGVLLLN